MAAVQRQRSSSFLACCFAAPQVEEAPQQHPAASGPCPVTASDLKPAQLGPAGATAVTAHAVSAKAEAAMPSFVQDKPAIPAGRRSSLDQAPLVQEMPDLRPLMALNIQRIYTDDDWFAAMAALEQLRRLHTQRSLQQLRLQQRISLASHASGALPAGGHDDDDAEAWHDAVSHTMSDAAVSDADREEVSRLADALEAEAAAARQLTMPVVREIACQHGCVPDPPLMFAEKHWQYCPVDVRPFCGYWDRDATRSNAFPLPIDLQMKLSRIGRMTHESVPGMWLHEEGNQLQVTATPSLMMPGIVQYNEYYNKDSTKNHWMLRRDIGVGKTVGQMYMTTDGVLIFRIETYSLFSKKPEWVGEDYTRLEDDGQTIITRQICHMHGNGSTCTQFLVGRRNGHCPPRRASLMGGHH